jgi:hypothetical protein
LFNNALFTTNDAPKSDAEYNAYVAETLLQRNYAETLRLLHNFDISKDTGDGSVANITGKFLIYQGE